MMYKQVADALGLSVRSVARLVASGELESMKARPGSKQSARRIPLSALSRYAQDRGLDLPEWASDDSGTALASAVATARERLEQVRCDIDETLAVLAEASE